MKAQRIITRNGAILKAFTERCVCGNAEEDIQKGSPNFAICHSCLRVYRYMEKWLPDGTKVQCWAVFYDPYLRDSIAGQVMIAKGVNLPENRFPSQIKAEKQRTGKG